MSRPKRAKSDLRLALVFVASQVALWTGCNAILGNGYGAFDESAGGGEGGGSPEGSTEGDALGGGEGGPGGDAMGLDGNGGDGNVVDGNVDGGSCPRGICPTMLVAAVGPQRIALGTTAAVDYVYWVSATSVGRVATDGSSAKKTDLAGAIQPPLKRGIAVSQGGIPYVTVPLRGGSICAADLSVCANGFIGSAGDSSSIAVDTSSIYVGIYADSSMVHGGIFQTSDLNGTSSMAYSMTDQVLDFQIVGATTFYRTSTAINHTTRTTTPVLSAMTAAAPVAFSINGTMMVIATANQLLTCTLVAAGSCPTPNVVALPVGVSAVLLYGTHILWAESGNGGSIHRCDFPTCANSELLAENQASPDDLAVDTGSIYWANHGNPMGTGGAIMKLSK